MCKCYGMNLATGEPVSAGEAGVIAAQSRRAGYSAYNAYLPLGGVAGDDITTGLPRVEELRGKKPMAYLAEISVWLMLRTRITFIHKY